MAIFRGGVKIFGSDVRLGLRRDRSLDNILLDPRFRDIEGGQKPENPNLSTTKPALINQMLQYIAQGEGLARSNRFYVSFRLPGLSNLGTDDEFEQFDSVDFENIDERGIERNGFAQGANRAAQDKDGRRVNAFCKGITMPDRTMATESVINGPGAPYNIVTDHTYGDITATFYADKYLRERQYFELWQKSAFNDRTNNYEFYDNYVSDIDIFQLGQFDSLNDRDSATYGIRLRECFPTAINQIQYDAGAQNQFVAIEVTFAYRDWLNFNLDIDSTGKVGGLSSGEVKAGGGIFSSLPPELRRTGRNVINQLKRSIPIGRVFGGKIFPPITF